MASFAVIGAIAGTVATLLFVGSALPMLVRAHRTRDLSSYSPANLIIANVGNLAQTLYVVTLPPGPVWAMHAFNLVVSGLMLGWWLRHHWLPGRDDPRRWGDATTRHPSPGRSAGTVRSAAAAVSTTHHATITNPSMPDASAHHEEEHSDDDPDHWGDRLGGPLARL